MAATIPVQELEAIVKINPKAICDRLVKQGKTLLRAPKQAIIFTQEPQANALLNDIENYPHTFVLACIMDRQIKAERAWLIPYRIAQAIGGFSMDNLSALSPEDINKMMRKPEPLHRFIDIMAECFYLAVQRIKTVYSGDAALIWKGEPSSAEVVYRFLEFKGVGPKIASMAVNILAREFKVPFSDYYSIDISADVHVRRVFSRLGLCLPNATAEQLIYKARALYPEFPGVMDFPCWEIGRSWCRPRSPLCSDCYISDLCITAKQSG